MLNKFLRFLSPGYFGLGFLLGMFFPVYLYIYKKAIFDDVVLNVIDFINIISK